MTYADTLDYLYHIAPAFEKVGAGAYKEGLANTIALNDRYGHPYKQYPCIHVAGTNGKGSVSHTLAAILQAQGLRVGLYTSPHLSDFAERIRINGTPIEHQWVVDFVEQERPFITSLRPSFFELTTAMAFRYFAEQKIDIAVVEVGMGGRLDCTNIIRPLLSIITNISLDHTQFLGASLASIAREKAGIIKDNTPCLVGEDHPATRPIFEEIARQRHAPLHFAHSTTTTGVAFQLRGTCQKENLNTILCAVALLRQQLPISEEAVRDGCAHVCERTGLQGRWQVLGAAPTTVCDTGHNLAAWRYLAPQLSAIAVAQQQEHRGALRIVFGMVDDKDVAGVLALLPRDARYYFCQASIPRAIAANKIWHLAQSKGLRGASYPSVELAYSAARAESSKDDFLFVGGSTYVVADLFAAIQH